MAERHGGLDRQDVHDRASLGFVNRDLALREIRNARQVDSRPRPALNLTTPPKTAKSATIFNALRGTRGHGAEPAAAVAAPPDLSAAIDLGDVDHPSRGRHRAGARRA